MKKVKNIIISNVNIHNNNQGCVALGYCAMGIVDKIMREHDQPYNFYLIGNGIPTYKKENIIFNNNKIDFYEIRNPHFYSFRSVVGSILKPKRLVEAYKVIRKADFFLDTGEGDSFSDIYGKRRFSSINHNHRLARQFNKPYCLLPQTIGPFHDSGLKAQACISVDKAKLVMCRDRQSKEYVETNFHPKAVDEYIDLAFKLPYVGYNFSQDKTNVGINVSGLLWKGGYTQDNQFNLSVDYKSLISSIIEAFLRMNCRIHLIPHVCGSESWEDDYAVLSYLYEKYNSSEIVLSPAFYDPIKAKSYIAGLDFFIGARMHSTIAAFSSGVPVIPMAYSRKFNGLFIDTLDYNHIVDLKSSTSDKAVEDILRAFNCRDVLKDEICDANIKFVEPALAKIDSALTSFFGLS